jgi:hypothetical protein
VLDVDSPTRQRVEHEPAESVVADNAHQGRPQAEPGCTRGSDGRRAARHQPGAVDQPVDLVEDDLEPAGGEDEIGVAIADNEQIELAHAGDASPPARGR